MARARLAAWWRCWGTVSAWSVGIRRGRLPKSKEGTGTERSERAAERGLE